MSSIGILTYFNYYNYGSMLQGYATQVALRKFQTDEDSCKLINYRYASPVSNSKYSLIKLRIQRFYHYIANLRESIIRIKYASRLSKKNILFDDFRDQFTNLTGTYYRNKQELEDNPPLFDIYVVGSDQTWSPKVSGGYKESPMFLDFIPVGHSKCAYAPSFGTNVLNDIDKKYLSDKVKNFDIISSREHDGVKLIQSVTSKEVAKVLDPTLLLTKEEWRKISIAPRLPRKGYILCYFIGDRDYYRNFAKQLSMQLQLPVFFIPVSWKDCNKGNNLLFDVGPREFIGLIDNAQVVLTDSFHGTAFSVNLNKNFYSFVKHSGGKATADNSRIFDFLFGLKLEDRLLEEYDGMKIDYSYVDFTPINSRLDKERRESYKVIESIVKINNHG